MKSFDLKLIKFISIFSTSLIMCSVCSAGQLGYFPIIQGSGKLLRDNIQLPAIKKLQIRGIAHLYIQQASHNELTIEAEDNILSTLLHEVKGDTLYIGLKNTSIYPTRIITYTLKIKNLADIKAFGDTKIICHSGLKLDTLSISVFNHAFANIWFNGAKLVALISNAANLTIGGFASRQEIIINEKGIFDGKQLHGSKGVLDITYSGHGIINVKDELQLNMPAEGYVQYLGKPKINKQISKHAIVSTAQEAFRRE